MQDIKTDNLEIFYDCLDESNNLFQVQERNIFNYPINSLMFNL